MKKIHAFSVLRNSDFRNLWLSQLISQTFLNALIFTQLLRVYELTRSNGAVSVLVLTIGIPSLLLGALAGVFVDRWDKKVVMFFCQFVRVIAVVAFVLSPASVAWIYILTLVIACVTQFWAPAEASTIPTIISGPKLLTANSVFTLTFFSTVILGNILAGPILALFGPHLTYVIIAGAFLVASIFVLRLPGDSVRSWLRLAYTNLKHRSLGEGLDREVWIKLRTELREGLAFIRKSKSISRAIVYLALSQTLIATLSAIAPGFADRVMHVKTTDVSVLVMLPAALGMVLGAVVVGQFFLKANRSLLVYSGLLTSALAIIIFSQTTFIARFFHWPPVIVGFILLVILGIANAFLDIPSNTILQENSTEDVRSRIYGVLTALVGAASVLPILLVGTLSDLVGVRRVLLGLGLVVLFFAIYNRSHDRVD